MVDLPTRSMIHDPKLRHADGHVEILPKPAIMLTGLPSLDGSDSRIFELFRAHVIPGLTGMRSRGFWENVVLSGCYSEPALLHAGLALAYAMDTPGRPREEHERDEKKIRAITEYNKSIQHLNRSLIDHNEASSRTVLVACVLFITLELFLGRIETAIAHLDQGRKLLLQSSVVGNAKGDGENEIPTILLKAKPQSMDDHLISVFVHLDNQSTYFGSDRPQFKLGAVSNEVSSRIRPRDVLNIPEAFDSIHEASQYFVIITNECMSYTGQTLAPAPPSLEFPYSSFQRQYICLLLQRWVEAFQRLEDRTELTTKSEVAWRRESASMLIQHACLFTLVSTFYIEVVETEFDYYLEHFKTIVELASSLPSPGQENGLDRFSLESGPIAPLWFTTMKCRDPYVRRRALALLRHAGRDGYWDATMLYQISRELIVYEEGTSQPKGVDYSSLEDMEVPHAEYTPEDLCEIIPLHRRIREVKLKLLDEDTGKSNLIMTRATPNAENEVVLSKIFVLER
jgi:hypothetical protein